jgi:hypothetical protein
MLLIRSIIGVRWKIVDILKGQIVALITIRIAFASLAFAKVWGRPTSLHVS